METPGLELGKPEISPVAKRRAYRESAETSHPGDPLHFVHEIMTAPVMTLSQEESIRKAGELFRNKRFRHLPIVNSEGILVGIISDRDYLRVLADSLSLSAPIRDYMVTRILTTESDSKIREAASIMFYERVGCLPVVSPGREVIGILTRTDILRALIQNPRLNLYA